MARRLTVFVGSLNREAPYFAAARGVGLGVYAFDEDTLAIVKLDETDEIDNPTFFTITPDGRRLYVNSEVFAWREGVVSAYRFDRERSRLVYLNKQPALGSITAHNTLARDGSMLLVANYGIGEGGPDRSVVAYGIEADGSLTPPIGSVRHGGQGPDASRQERAHAHCVRETTAGGIALVADLGIDRIISYRIVAHGLEWLAETALEPGSGPRHIALHPAGRLVFVINELNSTVTSLALDPASGRLDLLDVQPAVPAAARGGNHCSDLQISPDGRFLYAGNRGHDSIAIFAVGENGGLSLVGHRPCGGATPRNLCLTPSGRHLFCANQDADRVSIFRREEATGMLEDTRASIAVGTPMCVRIAD